MLADESDDECFRVWPENWRTVEIFQRCGCVFDIAVGPGGAWYQGVKPESMESVMRMSRVPRRDQGAMLDDLQAMQADALEILNAKP